MFNSLQRGKGLASKFHLNPKEGCNEEGEEKQAWSSEDQSRESQVENNRRIWFS